MFRQIVRIIVLYVYFNVLLCSGRRRVTNLGGSFRSVITSGTGNARQREREIERERALPGRVANVEKRGDRIDNNRLREIARNGSDRKRAKVILIPSTFAVCVTERRNGNPCTGISG